MEKKTDEETHPEFIWEEIEDDNELIFLIIADASFGFSIAAIIVASIALFISLG